MGLEEQLHVAFKILGCLIAEIELSLQDSRPDRKDQSADVLSAISLLIKPSVTTVKGAEHTSPA